MRVRNIEASARYGRFCRKNLYLKRGRRRLGKAKIAMSSIVTEALDRQLFQESMLRMCGAFSDFTLAAPRCSRCLNVLRGGYRAVELHVYVTPEGHLTTTEKVEHTYHCPDHCASVAERWKLAADRFARGWAEYIWTCSRCGQHLMAPPDHKKGDKFWCPGCGDLETAHGARA